jgi:hypothetical protein
MVSASRPMMAELRRLEVMLRTLGVKIETRWIPSAVNRYADSLSRPWDPGDVSVTKELVRLLSNAYEVDAFVFPHRPVGDHPIARRKYLQTQMSEDWGDGQARLWNPPFYLLQRVLKKAEDEGAQGSVSSTVASAAPVRAVGQIGDTRSRPGYCGNRGGSHGPAAIEPRMGARGRRDRTSEAWGDVIRDAVLTRTGVSATGGASVAADLLSQYCWSDNTWATRSIKWRNWVGFCEQDERRIFPASEGDVLAYIGFLKLEGRVSAASLPQYLSAVSRYHEITGVPSSTKSTLVHSLVRAYARVFDIGAFSRPMRVGLQAAVMRRVLMLGLSTPVPTLARAAAIVLFMFLFGCRASTAVGLRDTDVEITDVRVTAVLVHRKGKGTQNPLVLLYDRNPAVDIEISLLALLRRWSRMRPTNDAFFALAEEEDLASGVATYAVATLISALSLSAPRRLYLIVP